jgi:hypothetical protein
VSDLVNNKTQKPFLVNLFIDMHVELCSVWSTRFVENYT